MSGYKMNSGQKDAKYPAVRKSYRDYDWRHHDVITDQITIDFEEKMRVYVTNEVDRIFLDKATKTIPTRHANIALLDVNNLNGDLYDSGKQFEEINITELDGGTF